MGGGKCHWRNLGDEGGFSSYVGSYRDSFRPEQAGWPMLVFAKGGRCTSRGLSPSSNLSENPRLDWVPGGAWERTDEIYLGTSQG